MAKICHLNLGGHVIPGSSSSSPPKKSSVGKTDPAQLLEELRDLPNSSKRSYLRGLRAPAKVKVSKLFLGVYCTSKVYSILASARFSCGRLPILPVLAHSKTLNLPDYEPIMPGVQF